MFGSMLMSCAKAGATDPYFSSVVLLMQFNGDLTDVKGKAVTPIGNAAYSTARQKFGLGSCLFDGAGDYLSLANTNDFAFGSSDFTEEMWIYFNAWNAVNPLFNKYDGLASSSSQLMDIRSSGTGMGGYFAYGSATDSPTVSGLSIGLGAWVHFAIVRSWTTLKYYWNGIEKASANVSTHSYNNDANALLIGGDTVNSRWLNGNIGEVRITKGIARYTGNFTPPTAAFPTA